MRECERERGCVCVCVLEEETQKQTMKFRGTIGKGVGKRVFLSESYEFEYKHCVSAFKMCPVESYHLLIKIILTDAAVYLEVMRSCRT